MVGKNTSDSVFNVSLHLELENKLHFVHFWSKHKWMKTQTAVSCSNQLRPSVSKHKTDEMNGHYHAEKRSAVPTQSLFIEKCFNRVLNTINTVYISSTRAFNAWRCVHAQAQRKHKQSQTQWAVNKRSSFIHFTQLVQKKRNILLYNAV